MTVKDIDIDAHFRLRALRNDYVHAFVIYFVAEFTACSHKTVINTGKQHVSIGVTPPGSSSTRCGLHTLETDGFLLSWLCHNKTKRRIRRQIHPQGWPGEHGGSPPFLAFISAKTRFVWWFRKNWPLALTFNSTVKYHRWPVAINTSWRVNPGVSRSLSLSLCLCNVLLFPNKWWRSWCCLLFVTFYDRGK